jgi:hypothetical protein
MKLENKASVVSSVVGVVFAMLISAAVSHAAARPCQDHEGVARCDPNGQVVCKDGELDERFSCSSIPHNPQQATGGGLKRRRREKVLKFKPVPDRGQILKPGEPQPSDTLEESYRELKQQ